MTVPGRFLSERGDVRSTRRTHRLTYIIRELPRRLEALAVELRCSEDARVLDFGCADIPYRRFFGSTVDYLAADLPGNPDAALTIAPDGTVPLPDASVDAVLSTQVLEHVADPGGYLRECHRVLRPGGRLLLSTHGMMVYHPDPVDLWRWTCEGLRHVVAEAGFGIVRFEGIMGLTASGLQFLQDGLYWRLPAGLAPALAFVMQGLVALADRLEPAASRELNALVFALVAEKPVTP